MAKHIEPSDNNEGDREETVTCNETTAMGREHY